eukprot:scaffold1541_cov418-Prasinococcus_capsulatus_cf.AAC.27
MSCGQRKTELTLAEFQGRRKRRGDGGGRSPWRRSIASRSVRAPRDWRAGVRRRRACGRYDQRAPAADGLSASRAAAASGRPSWSARARGRDAQPRTAQAQPHNTRLATRAARAAEEAVWVYVP